MAHFHLTMQIIKRSAGRSVVAAAAYRAGERLMDERQGIIHDYRNRQGVEHKEILLPADAPVWVRSANREALWNAVEAGEKRKDAQTARELQLMIPRELDPPDRIRLVRDYISKTFVSRGMVADVCWHNKVASDGLQNPHAHVLLTMRPLTADGFGLKSRHEFIPDPSGRVFPDGRPVMVESNRDSWNSVEYLEKCRESWEVLANRALAEAGSSARIDRRSFLERGISRLPEPALRMAWYMRELYGSMRERFGQFQFARHFQAVEASAKEAFRKAEATPEAGNAARVAGRFFDWFERQIARLEPAREPALGREPRNPEVDHDR